MTERSKPAYGTLAPSDLTIATRRRFLQGTGLIMGFAVLGRRKAHAAGEEPSLKVIGGGGEDTGDAFEGFAPGGFIRIGRDNSITFVIPSTEMGQGIYTGEAMLLAEELEVGLDQVKLMPAPPDEKLYRQPILKSQATGGSTSIRGAWVPLRQAGAAARTMLIAAASAQWAVPPTECFAERAVVTHRPTGRTLAYGAIADAAARQPVPQDVPLKAPKDFKIVGKNTRRLDTPSKVNGTAVYGMDVKVPGMKIAAVAICPFVGGKLGTVEDGDARKIKGVADVIRIDNAVAVTADNFWAAKQGLNALKISWDGSGKKPFSSDAMWADLKDFSDKGKPVMGRDEGDPDGKMASAAKRVDAVYELPFLAHATMEPINTTVHVRPDACEIWLGTQAPTAVQATAAKVSGLPPEKVIVHNHLIGGGFGRRLVADSVEQAVAFAKQVSYPIKIIWTREQDIKHDLYRPAYYDRVSAGLDANGMPVAWTDRVTGGSVLGSYLPTGLPDGVLDSDAIEGAVKPPYALPSIRVDWIRRDPPIKVNWWRGVGPTHNVFVVESFMDELAHAAGKDPVEYRRALLKDNPRALGVLNLAAEKAGWGKPLPERTGRGISLHDSFGSFLATVVEATVTPAGQVRMNRIVAAVDVGMSVNPDSVKAQIEGGMVFGLSAALYNGITFRDGMVDQNNFNDYRQIRINEIPPFEVHMIESHEEPGGIGESGTVSAAPALGNAIFAATGKRLRRLPFAREELQEPDIVKQRLGMVPLAVGVAAAALGTDETDPKDEALSSQTAEA